MLLPSDGRLWRLFCWSQQYRFGHGHARGVLRGIYLAFWHARPNNRPRPHTRRIATSSFGSCQPQSHGDGEGLPPAGVQR